MIERFVKQHKKLYSLYDKKSLEDKETAKSMKN
jgi:hypothetical protein